MALVVTREERLATMTMGRTNQTLLNSNDRVILKEDTVNANSFSDQLFAAAVRQDAAVVPSRGSLNEHSDD